MASLTAARVGSLPNPFSLRRLLCRPCRLRLRLLSASAASPSSSSSSSSSSPWLEQWAPLDPANPKPPPTPLNPIDRIVRRLRNLDLSDDDVAALSGGVATADDPPRGEERLSDLLDRNWSRPESPPASSLPLLPWEREDVPPLSQPAGASAASKRRPRAPSLAELTIEDEELRRLRRLGMELRERTTVPKAGVTQAVVAKIHDVWRRSELVRLKFHEDLAHDMRTAHELVERRTGGLVIWRSGSVMVVYRGSNYKRPSASNLLDGDKISPYNGSSCFVPEISGSADFSEKQKLEKSLTPRRADGFTVSHKNLDNLTEEELEFNQMLDEFGPRFVDWWGTGVLPVDADLLPGTIPGFKTPIRVLPTGMRTHLTNAEMTNLRKMSRKLPCHFALGRNRNHQGLAAAILNIWEKSLVVKIAIKRGIQNTNNKLMAEELKRLTGGVLLLRNKYYIVMYRGKDFLPKSVATTLAEREELVKDIHNREEKTREVSVGYLSEDGNEEQLHAGTLAEFLHAQARWGRDVTAKEQEEMQEAAENSKKARLCKRIEHKLWIAESKKARAERILSKVEAFMVPVDPSDDREMITDEERSVFRKIGLRMKAYLPLGIRGVFDGVIENMHLHWKHRELVKLITKQKTLAYVEDTARLLEYESGGLLVAIERVPKGYALIYYRGKNYWRPINLRPRNLLTKAKALQRAVAMQRHEALSQHILQLESTIKQMKVELGIVEDKEDHSDNERNTSNDSTSFAEEDLDGTYEDDFDDDDDDDDYEKDSI